VWDVSRGFYVRPESSGLLLCACDEDARPPEDAQVDQAASERLAETVAAVAPRWSEHPLARSWAGLRSFAPDRRFVIGWDGQLAGLYWVTALGGHGLTVSCALADLVAGAVFGDADPRLAPFDPARCAAVTS
jgi:glycine/D-amino acid oxidase-like deaminating enzyme